MARPEYIPILRLLCGQDPGSLQQGGQDAPGAPNMHHDKDWCIEIFGKFLDQREQGLDSPRRGTYNHDRRSTLFHTLLLRWARQRADTEIDCQALMRRPAHLHSTEGKRRMGWTSGYRSRRLVRRAWSTVIADSRRTSSVRRVTCRARESASLRRADPPLPDSSASVAALPTGFGKGA